MVEVDVVLDVDVAVDLLEARRPDGPAARAAVAKASKGGGRVWLVAACLPSLIERLTLAQQTSAKDQGEVLKREDASSRAREALRSLLESAGILSSYGFDAEAVLESETPMGMLILRAADALTGDAAILSRDPDFLATDSRVMTPQDFVDRHEAEEDDRRALPFVDLARQQRQILTKAEKGFTTVLRHGQYIMGPEIRELERKLAEYVGVKHAICCASGTDALLLALMAYGVGPGDAVFTTPC